MLSFPPEETNLSRASHTGPVISRGQPTIEATKYTQTPVVNCQYDRGLFTQCKVSFRGAICPLLDPKCPPWNLKKYIDQLHVVPLIYYIHHFAPLAISFIVP